MALSQKERALMQQQKAQIDELVKEKQERDEIKNETPQAKLARETRDETVKRITEELETLGGKLFDDDDIVYQGTQLVLPETMSLSQGIDFLEKKRSDSETVAVFNRTFNFRPWDGAWCMWQVMKRVFGAVNHRGNIRYTMFGPIEDPPEMHTINVDVAKTEQVPWGRFSIPLLPDTYFTTSSQMHPEYGNLFQLVAEGPKKYRFRIEGVFTLIEEELKKNSLYRGKAFDGSDMPEFVDVNAIDRSKVVYSEEVQKQLEVSVWSQLRYTEASEKIGIPLKRAVLVHGPFGTGKTLALMLTGQEAIANGWTFIKARPGKDDLLKVLQTARLYQPCVVGYEDLDVIAAAVEEDERPSLTRLLDAFDGIEAKSTKILCVLTTNYPDRIHKGMVRPGRLDAMIEIDDLDEQGVEKLVKVRIPENQLDKNIDWGSVYTDAQGYKPAFVTEFADRAMRYVLVRQEGKVDGQVITTEDLCLAARGLRPQYDKMEGAQDLLESDSLGVVLDRRIKGVLEETLQPQLLVPANQ